MVLLILQKINVMSLIQILRILAEPIKLLKKQAVTIKQLIGYLTESNSQKGGPIAYLTPDFSYFILSTEYCVNDISKIQQRLLVGEEYIEKMQRAQTNFNTDYQPLNKLLQIYRDFVIKDMLQSPSDRPQTVIADIVE